MAEGPRTKLDAAWRREEEAELRLYEARARLSYARGVVAARNGPGLGLDGTPPTGIPTRFAAAEHRALGESAAALDLAEAALALARLERRELRTAVARSRRRS